MEFYISAEQAAAELGVSITTLYTYISRRGIRSQKVAGTKKRQYWKADIDRLKAGKVHKPASPFLGGLQDSKITLVTPEGPYYRGQSAIELSETYTFEDTAALLWDVDRASVFGNHATSTPVELHDLYKILKDVSVADQALAILPFVERANPRAFDLSHEGMCRTGTDLLRWYVAIFTGRDKPSFDPLHVQVARISDGGDEVADLIRRVLVISADHGFGAGTYAVRAVASTGVTPYRSVLAGFAISPGRRNPLGKREAIVRLLSEFAGSPDPQSVIARRMREGEALPGFAIPPPYVRDDPRVRRLIEDLRRIRGDHPIFVKTLSAFAYAEEVMDLYPGFALVNALINQVVGLPHSEALFDIGRCAGWVAHSIEQYEAGEIEPPVADYRGFLPRTV